jgi:hypothetical protein
MKAVMSLTASRTPEPMRTRLVRLADCFCASKGLARATVSDRVFGGSKVIDRIASGGDCTTGTYEAALLWFAANWPDGVLWPAGVERPSKPEAA